MHAPASPKFAVSPAARGFLAMVGANVALAFGPWLVRLADVGPIAAGFWRLALALPVLVVVVWLRPRFLFGGGVRRPGFPRDKRGRAFALANPAGSLGRPSAPVAPAIWAGLALGGLFFAADLATWHAGILRTRLANATLFGNVTGFLFPLYGYLVARTWPGRWQAGALLLAAAGVALLMGRSYELSPDHLTGDLLCIVAGLFYTLYLIGIDRSRGIVGPLPTLAVATAAGAPAMLLAALALGERVLPGNWTPLALLAGGSQLVGQGLLVYAVTRLRPVVIGLGLLLQPVIAAVIGWGVYAERLGALDFAGAGAIAVALVLVLVRRPERRAVSPPVPT